MKKSRLVITLALSLGLLFALSSNVFAATTRYEAESAAINGGAKITPANSDAISGKSFVGDNNLIGTDSVVFTVNVADAGAYTLTIAYGTINPDAADTIYVNGAKVADVLFPATEKWLWEATSEKTLTQEVTLIAGENKIKIGPKVGSVNLDYIEVVSAATTTTPAAATTTPADTTNPKTGDASMIGYILMSVAGLSGAGAVYFKKKK